MTLDTGANVSFMSKKCVERLGLPIFPNGQLTQLAIPKYRDSSIGEVDFTATECSTGTAQLRVRALILAELSCECYGGQTFHHDNDVVANITNCTVSIHGGVFLVQLPHHNRAPHPPAAIYKPVDCSAGAVPSRPQIIDERPPLNALPLASNPIGEPILMKNAKHLLPDGTYSIPLQKAALAASVLIMPPTPKLDSLDHQTWNPQVCQVVSGAAIYVNRANKALTHQKNTHFRALPMVELNSQSQPSIPIRPKQALQVRPASPESILKQIRINETLLSPDQQARLKEIHTSNLSAFNEDLTEGFKDEDNPYEATFSFRRENRPPPYKIWVPQYNQRCQDLLQAKLDEMEGQGVVVEPNQHKVEVKHASPCFITQKARAKHKPLEECSLDEVRFITCFNALNDSIHPIPGRSNSYIDILKFFGRHRYIICADMSNSYFQIKVAKKHWKYLAVMTPHRGLRILTRLGQGLLNSDVDLDQVLGRVLGDEQTAGFCLAARDDVFVGGNTVDECIANWNIVLSKLNKHNLKVSPRKVRIMLEDTEVFGHRIADGKVRPSDHILTSLAATTPDQLVTYRQVNSWKGLYKTLIKHLPHLASYMAPFDQACASKPSSATFDWSRPGILAAFNAATSHLSEIQETYLPHPEEQLVLQPDTSSSDNCIGWALYTTRQTGEAAQKLPVQYASAKLPKYMEEWSPCEKEGVGAVTSIDQVRHWINESLKTTIVMPDNKPVVEAAKLMKLGRHSTSSRLQQLLTSVNRSNVDFRHNSAKAGLHIVPDQCSRTPTACCPSKDCQVERFLDDIPAKVQCMPITLSSLLLSPMDPATLAALTPDINQLLGPGAGPIPLGSRQTWINLQAECQQCARFLACKRDGQMPGKKDSDKTVLNKMMKTCRVIRGLIVGVVFDPIQNMETERVYVPASLLEAILTIMHVRLSHPLPTQLQRTFERYFIAFRVRSICDSITSECSFCIALARFLKQLDHFNPSPGPLHPGTHMNIDIMQRTGQSIFVNCDRFSNFVTACIAQSQTREEMVKCILNTVTPVRHGSKVQVRTDRAKAFSSLAGQPDPQLEENGITLILGDDANPNKNAAVDKMMQELEGEIRRLSPEGHKLSVGTLSQAVNNLNNRTRGHGLTASQVHFSRDSEAGTNLRIDDEKLWQVREDRKEALRTAPAGHQQTPAEPGQTVFLRGDGTKHTAREPFLVTKVGAEKVTLQKMAHTNQPSNRPPRITSFRKQVDPKFIYIPPHKRFKQPKHARIVHHQGPVQQQRQVHRLQPGSCTTPRKVSGSPGRPKKADLEVEIIYIQRSEDEDEVNVTGEVGQLRLRPIGELLADIDQGVEGEEEGEVEEEGGDEGKGAVVREKLPAAINGPRQRRRPPREQWILEQDVPHQQEAPAQPQVAHQEGEQRHLTGSGRLTRPPTFYGVEEGREENEAEPVMDLSTSSVEREDPHMSSPLAASSSPTPPGSVRLTPMSTPATSPDTSAIGVPQNLSWQLPPMPCSLTAAERAQEPTQRHRHWSFTAAGVYPNHPRFLNWFGEWDPGPRTRRSSAEL